MKHLTLLLTLSLLLANISPSRGDWFYDFGDGTIPDTFVTEGIDSSFTLPSDTLQSDASVGVLSMWDANAPANGGTKIALGFDEEVFDGNVRLSAEINCTESSDNWFGLQVRANAPYGTQPKYFARIILDPQHPNGGRLYVGKDLTSTETEVVGSSWRASDFRRSYFVELEVTDDPATGFPEISGQLFDHEGGELLATASMIDSNVGGIPPITSGMALVSLWTLGNDVIYGAFDNIRAESLRALGDVNLDGEVNGLDVDPFVEVLLSGGYQPEADMNLDTVVNGLDVDPFVAAVVGGGVQQIPEPSTLLLCSMTLGFVCGSWKWSTLRRLATLAVVAVAMGLLLSAAAQAQPFIDDFEDGSATDGEPVTWAPAIDPWNQGGTVEVVNGDLLLTPSPSAPPLPIPGWSPDFVANYQLAEDRRFQDVSVHTQARVSGAGHGWVYVGARDAWNDPSALGTNVWASVGIDWQGNQLVELGGNTGSGSMSQMRRTTSLNIHENDVHLQLDVLGDTASLFAWEDGEEKPATPLLTRTLEPSQMVAGLVLLSYGQLRPSAHPTGLLNTASFRFVEAVPEPLLGDVNLDGEVNGLDVDLFVDVLLSGPYQQEADMNEDQVVNGLDVDPFVAAVVGGTQQIPEPSTLLLAVVALGVVGGWRKWGG